MVDRIRRDLPSNPAVLHVINNRPNSNPYEVINDVQRANQEPEVSAESSLEDVLSAGIRSTAVVRNAYSNPNAEQLTAQESAQKKIEKAMETISKMAEIQGKSWKGVAQVQSDGSVKVTLAEMRAESPKPQKEPSLFEAFKSAIQELFGVASKSTATNEAEAKQSITIEVPNSGALEDASPMASITTTPQ